MTGDDFDLLSRLLRERSGLVLTPDKGYLIESRLLPVARKWGLKNLDELVYRLRFRPEESLLRDVVEAMTTNESFFFRDIRPFDQFRSVVLPYLLTARASSRHIRVWSAACSSGQEPFSIAMILEEERGRLAGWTVDILATDLSTEMLAKAQAAIYSHFEVQRGLPIGLLIKYFKPHGDRWVLDPLIRDRVTFQPFNLLHDLSPLGGFDVILCRNVLIYFDRATKSHALDRLGAQLAPDGFLFLGGAETVVGLTERLQPMAERQGLYCQARVSPVA